MAHMILKMVYIGLILLDGIMVGTIQKAQKHVVLIRGTVHALIDTFVMLVR